MTKQCAECKEVKPLTEFFKDKGFKDGHYSRCKVCKTKKTLAWRENKKQSYNNYMKQYRKDHPDTVAAKARDRRKSLRLRYNLTQEAYDALLQAQNGTCALCPLTPNDVTLHVDHDHKTGKVRGLLCPGHNRSIAILDNKELLEKALEYIIKAA